MRDEPEGKTNQGYGLTTGADADAGQASLSTTMTTISNNFPRDRLM